jgi:hypothetical protein
MAARCPVIYICHTKNNEVIVSKILKATQGWNPPYPIRVGEPARLNRQTMKLDRGWDDFDLVVFVEPNFEKNKTQWFWQSEIPLIDGRLIPYPVTSDQLVMMIGK